MSNHEPRSIQILINEIRLDSIFRPYQSVLRSIIVNQLKAYDCSKKKKE